MQILIEPAAQRYKSRRVSFEQLDDGIGCAKLTAVVEPVEGDFGILADLDEVAVGITHVATPFPAVIV
jgi:hypothetical protein